MLRLSTKSRYAARMLAYLASTSTKKPANTNDIAEAEGISKDYVEQILTRLRTSDMVTSHRGINGGFTLARDPKDITILEVVEQTEGPISIAPCIKQECNRSTQCATQKIWESVNKCIEKTLASYTIEDLRNMAAESNANISFQI